MSLWAKEDLWMAKLENALLVDLIEDNSQCFCVFSDFHCLFQQNGMASLVLKQKHIRH